MTFIGLFTGDIHHERLRDEDDQLLQFAIQQSLMDGNTDPVEQVPVYYKYCTINLLLIEVIVWFSK